jgi:hypothetical protein
MILTLQTPECDWSVHAEYEASSSPEEDLAFGSGIVTIYAPVPQVAGMQYAVVVDFVGAPPQGPGSGVAKAGNGSVIGKPHLFQHRTCKACSVGVAPTCSSTVSLACEWLGRAPVF